MAIENRVPQLVREKLGERFSLALVQRETALSYPTVSAWMKDRPTRFDAKALETWCRYLGVGVGKLLVYTPDEQK